MKLHVKDACIICHDDDSLQPRQGLSYCSHGLRKEDKLVLDVEVPPGAAHHLVERGRKARLATLRKQRVHSFIRSSLTGSRHQCLYLNAAHTIGDWRLHPIEALCGIERGDRIIPERPEVPGDVSHCRTTNEEHVVMPAPEWLVLSRLGLALSVRVVQGGVVPPACRIHAAEEGYGLTAPLDDPVLCMQVPGDAVVPCLGDAAWRRPRTILVDRVAELYCTRHHVQVGIHQHAHMDAALQCSLKRLQQSSRLPIVSRACIRHQKHVASQ
mmetsp:Transcript_37454/g.107915  ORF Transcript_37454/g.107915 Transcript_37454/m.107915 type:complete len:269 (+) Transcript_37454:107-913(+)